MNPIKWGHCHNEGCEQPCPWDMAGIILFDEVYCSPECAKAGLEAMPDEPREVTLHDPQYHVDRGAIGLDESMVDITRTGDSTPETKIETVAELLEMKFRPEIEQ